MNTEDSVSIKANELVEKFYRKITNATQSNSFLCARFRRTISYRNSKECAIICVDEILLSIQDLSSIEEETWEFWQQVLEKIKSL